MDHSATPAPSDPGKENGHTPPAAQLQQRQETHQLPAPAPSNPTTPATAAAPPAQPATMMMAPPPPAGAKPHSAPPPVDSRAHHGTEGHQHQQPPPQAAPSQSYQAGTAVAHYGHPPPPRPPYPPTVAVPQAYAAYPYAAYGPPPPQPYPGPPPPPQHYAPQPVYHHPPPVQYSPYGPPPPGYHYATYPPQTQHPPQQAPTQPPQPHNGEVPQQHNDAGSDRNPSPMTAQTDASSSSHGGEAKQSEPYGAVTPEQSTGGQQDGGAASSLSSSGYPQQQQQQQQPSHGSGSTSPAGGESSAGGGGGADAGSDRRMKIFIEATQAVTTGPAADSAGASPGAPPPQYHQPPVPYGSPGYHHPATQYGAPPSNHGQPIMAQPPPHHHHGMAPHQPYAYPYPQPYPPHHPRPPYVAPYTAATSRGGVPGAPPAGPHYYATGVPGQHGGMRGLVTPPPKRQKSSGSLSSRSASPAVGASASRPSASPTYSRKDKSLGLMCENFMARYGSPATGGAGISIDEAAMTLGVERRRIYDIINILESIHVVSRRCKNTYNWHGTGGLPLVFARLQRDALEVWPEDARKHGLLTEDDDGKEAGKQKGTPVNAVGSDEGHRAAVATLVAAAEAATSSRPSSASAQRPYSAQLQRSSVSSKSGDGDGSNSVPQKEKSLGKLTQRFVQLFLVGHDVISLTDASDKILGSAEELAEAAARAKAKAGGVGDGGNGEGGGGDEEAKKAAAAAAARGLKTKVRRLYDIANVMVSVGIVVKVSSGNSLKSRPSFRWVYGVLPADLPRILAAHEEAHREDEDEVDEEVEFKGDSGEDLLAAIVSTGAKRQEDIDWSKIRSRSMSDESPQNRWKHLLREELGEEDVSSLEMSICDLASLLLGRKKARRRDDKTRIGGGKDAREREELRHEKNKSTRQEGADHSSERLPWSSPVPNASNGNGHKMSGPPPSSTSRLIADLNGTAQPDQRGRKAESASVPITPLQQQNGQRRDVDASPQLVQQRPVAPAGEDPSEKMEEQQHRGPQAPPSRIAPHIAKDGGGAMGRHPAVLRQCEGEAS